MVDECIKNEDLSQQDFSDYFKPASWILKFDFIHHLVLFNNVLAAVIEEKGGGKTTFCKLLLNSLQDKIKVLYLNGLSSIHTKNDFLVRVTEALNQAIDKMASIEQLIDTVNVAKEHFLVVIDDAEKLSPDFIHDLLNIIKSQGEPAFFHVCLAGNFALARQLNLLENTEDFKDLIHAFEPGALKYGEFKTYVLRKLMLKANNLNRYITSEKNFENFFKLTEGKIAKINKNLDYFQPHKKWSMKLMAAAGVLLTAGLTYWLSQGVLSSGNHDQQTLRDMAELQEAAYPINASNNVESSNIASIIPPYYILARRVELQTLNIDELERQFEAREVSPVQDNMESIRQAALVNGHSTLKMNQEHVSLKAVAQAKAAAFEATYSDDKRNQQKAQHLASKQLPIRYTDRPQQAVQRVKTPAAAIALNHSAHAAVYTIQLIASRSRRDVELFKSRHAISNATIGIAKRDGQNWYVLAYGQYQNHQQASVALRQLPANLSKLGAWVRKTADLSNIG